MSKHIFEKLRFMLQIYEMWYGDLAKIYTADGVDIDEDTFFDIIITFVPMDKQCHVTITFHFIGGDFGEKYDNYYFTWYDNRDFEVYTKNGVALSDEEYEALLELLKKANFKFFYEEFNESQLGKSSIDKFSLKEPEE